MRIRLQLIAPPNLVMAFDHAGPLVRIGRKPKLEATIKGKDPAFEVVSWEHATIRLCERGATIRDTSSNGVYVNGAKIVCPVPIREKDVIQLGKSGPSLVVATLETAIEGGPKPTDIPSPDDAMSAGPRSEDGSSRTGRKRNPEEPSTNAPSATRLMLVQVQRNHHRTIALATILLAMLTGLAGIQLWRTDRNIAKTARELVEAVDNSQTVEERLNAFEVQARKKESDWNRSLDDWDRKYSNLADLKVEQDQKLEDWKSRVDALSKDMAGMERSLRDSLEKERKDRALAQEALARKKAEEEAFLGNPNSPVAKMLSKRIPNFPGIDHHTPLEKALEILHRDYGLIVRTDDQACLKAGVPRPRERQVSLRPGPDETVRSVLDKILTPLRLTFEPQRDHVLIVPKAHDLSIKGTLPAYVLHGNGRVYYGTLKNLDLGGFFFDPKAIIDHQPYRETVTGNLRTKTQILPLLPQQAGFRWCRSEDVRIIQTGDDMFLLNKENGLFEAFLKRCAHYVCDSPTQLHDTVKGAFRRVEFKNVKNRTHQFGLIKLDNQMCFGAITGVAENGKMHIAILAQEGSPEVLFARQMPTIRTASGTYRLDEAGRCYEFDQSIVDHDQLAQRELMVMGFNVTMQLCFGSDSTFPQLRQVDDCAHCKGRGTLATDTGRSKCSACGGSGKQLGVVGIPK